MVFVPWSLSIQAAIPPWVLPPSRMKVSHLLPHPSAKPLIPSPLDQGFLDQSGWVWAFSKKPRCFSSYHWTHTKKLLIISPLPHPLGQGMQDSGTGGLAALSGEAQGRSNSILLMSLQQQEGHDSHFSIIWSLRSLIYHHLITFHDYKIIYLFRAEGTVTELTRGQTHNRGSMKLCLPVWRTVWSPPCCFQLTEI